jgi:H+/Cl- antiporter ClcA
VDRELPGIILAALTTLSLGAVLGPEAPLIAIGGGLAALTVHLLRKDAPPMGVTIIASAGSFAAISTLLGSPLLGAFLIMEAAGVAGATLSLVALPGLTATTYQLLSGRSFTQVLFSGQDALPQLVAHATDYSLGVLLMLAVAKCFVYGLSLSAFRGGPVFPAMFIGAVIGIAAAGLPGMNMAAGIAMGIGALATAMLRLPLTSALLATVLLGADGVATTPEVVVAVAVAFVGTNLLPDPAARTPDSTASRRTVLADGSSAGQRNE